MNQMIISDIRCICAGAVLFIVAIYTFIEGVFTIPRRIKYIYLWTDVRYMQIIRVFMTMAAIIVVLHTFDDLQAILMVGTMAEGWFGIGRMPQKIFETCCIVIGAVLLVCNYMIFGRNVANSGKKMKQIMIEIIPLNMTALGIILNVILMDLCIRALEIFLEHVMLNAGYEIDAVVKASLCIIVSGYMIFDARLAKKKVINLSSINYETDERIPAMNVWEEDEAKTKREDRYIMAKDKVNAIIHFYNTGQWKR